MAKRRNNRNTQQPKTPTEGTTQMTNDDTTPETNEELQETTQEEVIVTSNEEETQDTAEISEENVDEEKNTAETKELEVEEVEKESYPEKELEPTNFPLLAGRLGGFNLVTETNKKTYLSECIVAFRSLRTVNNKNKDQIKEIMADFCKGFCSRVKSGEIDRTNYTTYLHRATVVNGAQLNSFIGMLYEMYREETVLNDFKKSGSLDKYFHLYNIPGNKEIAMKVVGEVLAGQ